MKTIYAILVTTLFLTGCNDQVYDVDYYFANQNEAKKIIEQCKAGEVTDKNCDNAKEAMKKQSRADWLKAHGGK
ncbi:hypothetical protein FIZ21_23065 [Salmonella enterica]|nr:hypothetical protein [Salmonella enterica]